MRMRERWGRRGEEREPRMRVEKGGCRDKGRGKKRRGGWTNGDVERRGQPVLQGSRW